MTTQAKTPQADKPSLRGPAIITTLAVILALALGTWQVKRLFWKRELIAQIDARAMAPVVRLPLAGAIDADEWRFRRVDLRGQYLYDREAHVLARDPLGRLGYNIFTPLRRQNDLVMVNRGWVPEAQKDPASRAAGQVAGTVAVRGVVRVPWARPMFIPENDAAKNMWFYPDIRRMAAGIAGPLSPVFVEADATPNPGGLPMGGLGRHEIPNNHLEYAITWYALALVGVIIFLIYRRQQNQE